MFVDRLFQEKKLDRIKDVNLTQFTTVDTSRLRRRLKAEETGQVVKDQKQLPDEEKRMNQLQECFVRQTK